MLLQKGDKRKEVGEVQKLLSMIGYDLIIDGEYELRTTRSVKAFQKKYRLEVSGDVDDKTYQALKAAQKRTSKEIKGQGISKNYGDLKINMTSPLQDGQYIKQVNPKSQIFIYTTCGSQDASSAIKTWNKNEPRVSTAFAIGGNGEIFEAFNPDFWSFHLGAKGSKGKLDRISIGISVCSYGPLKKKGDKFYAWPDNYSKEIPSSEVCELKEEFRGTKYFHKYTDAQIESIEKLLDYLINEYGIEVQNGFSEKWCDYKDDVIKEKLPGIWTHTNVRKDKLNSYPDKRLLEVLNKASK